MRFRSFFVVILSYLIVREDMKKQNMYKLYENPKITNDYYNER